MIGLTIAVAGAQFLPARHYIRVVLVGTEKRQFSYVLQNVKESVSQRICICRNKHESVEISGQSFTVFRPMCLQTG